MLQGRAKPLPPLPPPGSCTPPPPAAEVTPRSTGSGSAGPGAWKVGGSMAGVVILDHSLLHREVRVAFGASAEHPNISHRPQRSVPEELAAPLELPQPLSDLVDGRSPHPSPSLRRPALGEGIQVQPQGHLFSNSTCSGATSADSKPESPSTHTLLSLFRLWDPTQAPKATRAPAPPLPGPAAQAGRTRHG